MSNGRFVGTAQFFDSEGRLTGESNLGEFNIPDELNNAYRTYVSTGWAAVAAKASVEILQADGDVESRAKTLVSKVGPDTAKILG